jgi:hypothetical protein
MRDVILDKLCIFGDRDHDVQSHQENWGHAVGVGGINSWVAAAVCDFGVPISGLPILLILSKSR